MQSILASVQCIGEYEVTVDGIIKKTMDHDITQVTNLREKNVYERYIHELELSIGTKILISMAM